MRTSTLIIPLLLLAVSTSLPSAYAAPKPKVTVGTLAGTYTCTTLFFTDSSETTVSDFSIVVSKSGAISGAGVIKTTIPGCDPFNQDGIDCTPERSFSFTMPKLATPKKKSIFYQSALKKKKVDATTALTLSGTVKTFFSSVRYRSIDGVASLGSAANASVATISCTAPETVK